MSPAPRITLIVALLVLAVFTTACGATAVWIPVESADNAGDVSAANIPAELAFAEEAPTPVEPTATPVPETPAASEELCAATANSWIHSAALNRIGANGNPEMNQVAMANVAEWLERSVLVAPDAPVIDRAAMFNAFTDLQEAVAAEFANDWAGFQASSSYANSDAAQVYEAHRDALIPFVNEHCDSVSPSEMSAAAKARTDELVARFGTASTFVESDSLPGHTIFTHSSGRLIASFPSAWEHLEVPAKGDVLVDLAAAPKLERFLNNEAVDGVRLQLVEAAGLGAFEARIEATTVASECTETSRTDEQSAVRISFTQGFTCDDHSASIIGQYNEARGVGLIIEASFDSPEASNADLIRLASIANSALWS